LEICASCRIPHGAIASAASAASYRTRTGLFTQALPVWCWWFPRRPKHGQDDGGLQSHASTYRRGTGIDYCTITVLVRTTTTGTVEPHSQLPLGSGSPHALPQGCQLPLGQTRQPDNHTRCILCGTFPSPALPRHGAVGGLTGRARLSSLTTNPPHHHHG
jgi:hypothetical protein